MHLPIPPRFLSLLVSTGLLTGASAQTPPPAASSIPADWRNIATGWTIPDKEYADQPYLVKCDDGAWLCVITTSDGHEGATSQQVVATRSTDFGRTWSPLIEIERVGPPESSYVTAVKVPSGRIYAFYNYNRDNVREVKRIDGRMEKRVDTLGYFVFKYSDDHGLTWSSERHEIPIRETEIDRENIYGGRIRFFWHVGRPLIHEGAVYVTLHKVGDFGPTFMSRSEGAFLRSDNLLTERDPKSIRWETLPEGDVGLRAPEGAIAEEQSIVALSDGSLFTVYRTETDHPVHAWSRDDGRTWTEPAFMTYGPGARKVKHTRAANFVWPAGAGRYLYWFHNHGGFTYHNQRNPAWLAAGHEVDTPEGKAIAWSEPEILLYDDDMLVRMSYPDFLEDDGRFFVTQTQKTIARVHEIPAEFLELLLRQHTIAEVARGGLLYESGPDAVRAPLAVPRPELPPLRRSQGEGGGFTLDLRLRLDSLAPGQTVVEARDAEGNGYALTTTDRGTLQLSLRGPFGPDRRSDFAAAVIEDLGIAEASWDCDPGRLEPGRWHHVTVIVDGGPKIIAFVVDGELHDGGDRRQFGWARFPRELRHVNFGEKLRLAPRFEGELRDFRLYDRALRTTEAVGNWRAAEGGTP